MRTAFAKFLIMLDPRARKILSVMDRLSQIAKSRNANDNLRSVPPKVIIAPKSTVTMTAKILLARQYRIFEMSWLPNRTPSSVAFTNSNTAHPYEKPAASAFPSDWRSINVPTRILILLQDVPLTSLGLVLNTRRKDRKN